MRESLNQLGRHVVSVVNNKLMGECFKRKLCDDILESFIQIFQVEVLNRNYRIPSEVF